MGHEKRDCIALIGLVIVGLQRVFVLLYLLPFEVRGDGKHLGRYRHNRLPLASVVVYHREHTVPRGGFSVFAVPASRLHSMERQSFLVCDGIQTLDMLSIGLGSKKDRFSSSRPISQSGLVIVGLLSIWNATCYGGHYFYSFFSTSSQNGAWEKRLHCLDWACDCWVTEGPNKDRFSSWRPISDACTCTNKSCRALVVQW